MSDEMKKIKYEVGDEVLVKGYIVEVGDPDDILPYKISLHNCEMIDNRWCTSSNFVEGDWIPCSEKMPEVNRSVMFQIEDDMVYDQFAPRIGYYNGDGSWEMWCHPYKPTETLNKRYNVIAWRPLPKRYIKPVIKPKDIFKEAGYSEDICKLANKTCADIGCAPEAIIDLLEFIRKKSNI